MAILSLAAPKKAGKEKLAIACTTQTNAVNIHTRMHAQTQSKWHHRESLALQ